MSGSRTYTRPNSVTSFMHPSAENHETRVVYRPKAMAIVFVPGVMGSNLRNKGDKTSVWLPPDGAFPGLKQAWNWSDYTPERRQQMLNPDNCEVDDLGQLSLHHRPLPMLSSIPSSRDIEALNRAMNTLPCGLNIEEAIERGWGSAHWDSYGEILEHLQVSLNSWAHGEERLTESLVRSLSDLLGAQDALNEAREDAVAPLEAVTAEHLRELADYQFPVYCAGYNWLQGNKQSATDIVENWFPRFKKHCRESIGARWEGAIIVTHSMGGLVGRALVSLIEHSENILGVVHGAMPANGAAAFYTKMRGGNRDGSLTGWVAAEILGRSARETVPVLANAPGPLELLPTPDYERCLQREKGSSQWLEAGSDRIAQTSAYSLYSQPRLYKEGEGPIITRQPQTDVVNDIYINDTSWYRMIADPMMINPGGSSENSPIEDFSKRVILAMAFHEKLMSDDGGYHSATFAFYGDDENNPSYGIVRWHCELLNGDEAPRRVIRTLEDNYLGRLKVMTDKGEKWLFLGPPEDAGDGTVPSHSGRAPLGHGGVQALFSLRDLAGKNHQSIYDNMLARRCTEYAIVRIALSTVKS